jgi:metal-responsive CopG/Arc/MetJ family transcriptional regulator
MIKMKRRNIYLPEKLEKDIQKIADRKGINFSEMVRYILFQYVEADKNE